MINIKLTEPQFGRAKRIRIWKNGDRYSVCHELVINPNRFRTWNSILQYVTNILVPEFGAVRKLISLTTKKSVCCFNDLDPNDRYVAIGLKGFKPIKNGYKTPSEINLKHRNKSTRLYSGEFSAPKFRFLEMTKRRGLTVICIVVNNKVCQTPMKIVLNEYDLDNWKIVLQFLANKCDIPDGIKDLYTIFGDVVTEPHSLQHGYVYVIVPNGEKFVQIDYMSLFENVPTPITCIATSIRPAELNKNEDNMFRTDISSMRPKFASTFNKRDFCSSEGTPSEGNVKNKNMRSFDCRPCYSLRSKKCDTSIMNNKNRPTFTKKTKLTKSSRSSAKKMPSIQEEATEELSSSAKVTSSSSGESVASKTASITSAKEDIQMLPKSDSQKEWSCNIVPCSVRNVSCQTKKPPSKASDTETEISDCINHSNVHLLSHGIKKGVRYSTKSASFILPIMSTSDGYSIGSPLTSFSSANTPVENYNDIWTTNKDIEPQPYDFEINTAETPPNSPTDSKNAKISDSDKTSQDALRNDSPNDSAVASKKPCCREQASNMAITQTDYSFIYEVKSRGSACVNNESSVTVPENLTVKDSISLTKQRIIPSPVNDIKQPIGIKNQIEPVTDKLQQTEKLPKSYHEDSCSKLPSKISSRDNIDHLFNRTQIVPTVCCSLFEACKIGEVPCSQSPCKSSTVEISNGGYCTTNEYCLEQRCFVNSQCSPPGESPVRHSEAFPTTSEYSADPRVFSSSAFSESPVKQTEEYGASTELPVRHSEAYSASNDYGLGQRRNQNSEYTLPDERPVRHFEDCCGTNEYCLDQSCFQNSECAAPGEFPVKQSDEKFVRQTSKSNKNVECHFSSPVSFSQLSQLQPTEENYCTTNDYCLERRCFLNSECTAPGEIPVRQSEENRTSRNKKSSVDFSSFRLNNENQNQNDETEKEDTKSLMSADSIEQ